MSFKPHASTLPHMNTWHLQMKAIHVLLMKAHCVTCWCHQLFPRYKCLHNKDIQLHPSPYVNNLSDQSTSNPTPDDVFSSISQLTFVEMIYKTDDIQWVAE